MIEVQAIKTFHGKAMDGMPGAARMVAHSFMHAAGPKNPLHGITLEMMVTQLVAHYGWEMLGRMIPINCFNWNPSIKSSLTFLRRTPWARAKVEALYLDSLPDMQPRPDDGTDSKLAGGPGE